ncbi:BrnA antitoxin family protein [Oricola sp.]|uniref:BrnA antitoxin family protein n=1 Tax=Oricola sp. TaxID=1979950 RepID=UPI0025FB5A54|nr:BrnA antitoxin family protein [Oricola sp.]MCI5073506.1 BrnA antitoxin family protein [Oricola sp.]
MPTKRKTQTDFTPGHGYSREDWDAVSDSPEITADEMASAVPFAEAHPELAEKMRKKVAGRPRSDNPKQAISIRLDREVVEKFKATGPGWQSRINEVLRKARV